jgi:hypothetical protein
MTSEEHAEVKRLRAQVAQLRRANEILKAAATDSTGRCNTILSVEVCGGHQLIHGASQKARPVARRSQSQRRVSSRAALASLSRIFSARW